MMMSESLHLDQGVDSITFKLHPVVILSILDQYKRRNEDQERVIGTLLGIRNGSSVQITNCFPVPHVTANNETAAINKDYHDTMLSLQHKVNPEEQVVGWYTTDDKITYVSSILHDHYSALCQDCVMLTVDVALTNSRMAVRAYTSHTLLRQDEQVISRYQSLNPDNDPNDNRVTARFSHARMVYYSHEAERIGVDAMINSIPDGDGIDAPATMLTHTESLSLSLTKLRHSIIVVQEYVRGVQRGEIKGDPALGRQIANTLAQVPHLTAEVANDTIQDLLMMVYLAKYTRTQAALTDKINFLL